MAKNLAILVFGWRAARRPVFLRGPGFFFVVHEKGNPYIWKLNKNAMKKIYVFVLMTLLFSGAQAQYYYLPAAAGNPSSLNQENAEYPYGSGLPAGWTVVRSTSSSPAWSNVEALPFDFEFNGDTVTHYLVSSTGIMTFDTTTTMNAPAASPANLPSNLIPDNSICVWGVEATGSNDNVVVKTFGTAPNREFWVFFTSMSGAGTNWSYWSIVLDEASNNIWIVDQRHSGSPSMTLGLQIDTAEAYEVAGSPSIQALAGTDFTSADNWHYTFVQGTLPARDLKAIEVDIDEYLTFSNAPFTMAAEYLNQGADTVMDVDFNYQVDGGTVVTTNLTGLQMMSFDTETFSVANSWTPAGPGTYQIKIWTDNVNGDTDFDPTNDTLMATVYVVDTVVDRMPLYETFTSSTCPPCTPANTNMEDLFESPTNLNQQTSLKYQMSWPGAGDPYYTAEGGVRRQYYGVNSVPWVTIDGGWNGNGNVLDQSVMNFYKDIPAFMDISATYSVAPNAVHVDVEIDPYTDFSSTQNTLHVAIFEYRTENNVESNGETEFFHVMKKMLPGANGTNLGALTGGMQETRSFDYVFNGNYRLPNNANDPINHNIEHSIEDFNNLGVVVWVQDMGTAQVHQSAYATLVASVNDVVEEEFSLFPNPATEKVTVALETEEEEVRLEVVNTLGQPVYETTIDTRIMGSQHEIDVQGLDAGVYMVYIVTAKGIGAQPLIVQ
jgi:hypothetical protein